MQKIAIFSLLFFTTLASNVFAGTVGTGEALAPNCVVCHGYNGAGSDFAPALAGKSESDLLQKLKEYKNQPARTSVMSVISDKYTKEELTGLATYFSSLAESASKNMSFKRDILPILQSKCVACHSAGGAGNISVGLELGSYEGVIKGTGFGSLIDTKHPQNSALIIALKREDGFRMPFGRAPLTDQEINAVTNWVSQGAKNN